MYAVVIFENRNSRHEKDYVNITNKNMNDKSAYKLSKKRLLHLEIRLYRTYQ
jgi:hypothetical protein